MKVEWEESDIVTGRKYSKKGISEIWMIGHVTHLFGAGKYVSVSLSDGMVTDVFTKEDLAKDLTEGEYVPLELLN